MPDDKATDKAIEVVGDYSILNGNTHKRSDLRLARRAANNKWPVTKAIQQHAVDKADALIDSDDPRVSLGAVKAIKDMVGHNIDIDSQADAADEPARIATPDIRVIIVQPPALPRADSPQTPNVGG